MNGGKCRQGNVGVHIFTGICSIHTVGAIVQTCGLLQGVVAFLCWVPDPSLGLGSEMDSELIPCMGKLRLRELP